jgi:ribonuclease BN (tRNA processing enzyme)
MKITILGNGGAINDGLPYNSFLIGGDFLCEVPPDIMISLAKYRVDPEKILTIYISHLHADHCYGLPFLVLDIFFRLAKKRAVLPSPIRLLGPSGIAGAARNIVSTGLGSDHPVMKWMDMNIQYYEVNDHTGHSVYGDTVSGFFRMKHPFETWGFTIGNGKDIPFAYVPDTLWNENIEALFRMKPRNVLIDLGGESDDPAPVHLSEKDLVEKIAELKIEGTRFWGTHLKCEKKSRAKELKYVRAGSVIEAV